MMPKTTNACPIYAKTFDDRAELGTITIGVAWRSDTGTYVTLSTTEHHLHSDDPAQTGPGYSVFFAPSSDRLRRYADETIAEADDSRAVYGYPIPRAERHWTWTYRTLTKG